jgi:glycosyltransferase involved in cell wall biosynthesis
MNVVVLTSLFPSTARPFEGLFAERRWSEFARAGHRVRVVAPLPRASRWLGPAAWRSLARAAPREQRGALAVVRPRYWHWPGRARANARAFARAGVRAIAALARDERPDVVLADYAWPAAAAVEGVHSLGLPFAIHGRGSDVIQVAQFRELAAQLAAALRSAGHWAAVSADLVERMDRLAGLGPRGVLIPNGVDAQLFHPGPRAAARAALGLPERGLRLLVVGHLIERKDPLLALEAARAWAARRDRSRPGEPVHLNFLGRGPLQAALERAASGSGPVTVEILGERPPQELSHWYRAADLLLLTSSREGRPNVVLEALASGLPVVATAAGGTPELLEGLPHALCASRDGGDLAERIQATLADPPPTEELVQRARALSWERSSAQLERFLADVLTGPAPAIPS